MLGYRLRVPVSALIKLRYTFVKTLERLQQASKLNDLAKILGFTPNGLSYILYKLPEKNKYRKFEIPKKSGGVRIIQAPVTRLSLLQQRLAEKLYKCIEEIQSDNSRFLAASYGFQKNKTIISNADCHKRRRFVFNVDIADFFGSINFGRVRGFFIRDKFFSFDPAIATVVAQIACYENALPQGSPCSPVISNLIGNILDLRLLALARDARCTYTRYADDLTFSTNHKLFPEDIAVQSKNSDWIVGRKLRKEIENAGFKLNDMKSRMSTRHSRQTVTGLVVNTKPNVNRDYYRTARAMCHTLFRTGQYRRFSVNGDLITNNLNPLEGMLSYIYFVKFRMDRKTRVNKFATKAGECRFPQATKELYKSFLFYKYFVAPAAPLIVTEGKSDIIYLECATQMLAKDFPALMEKKDGNFIRQFNFLRPSSVIRDVLNLGQGTSGQANLISNYSNDLKKFVHQPMKHPVIIICDNDEGSKPVFKQVKQKTKIKITTESNEDFYFLGENLYLIKVPEGQPHIEREIEHLFRPHLLTEKIKGKSLDLKKEHGNDDFYGKMKFAEEIIRPRYRDIDFSEFEKLLSRIEKCVLHYLETVKSDATTRILLKK